MVAKDGNQPTAAVLTATVTSPQKFPTMADMPEAAPHFVEQRPRRGAAPHVVEQRLTSWAAQRPLYAGDVP